VDERRVSGSLEGRVILVTRAADQVEALAAPLRSRGATVVPSPAIEILPAADGPLDDALRRASDGDFAWIVLTSRAGVAAVGRRLAAAGLAWSDLRGSVAAVGEGTAAAIQEWGRRADLVPASFTTEALGVAMPVGSGRALLARADIAPAGLEAVLASKGWTVERVDAYRTRLAGSLVPEAAAGLRDGRVDAVTFTSASTVEGFARAAGRDLIERLRTAEPRPKVIGIGPVTADAARRLGLPVDATARPHTIEGLVSAVERAVGAVTTKERT
jgi:uroporphyrinogen-III synthase